MELYKARNNLSTDIIKELFQLREGSYNLRNQTDFELIKVNTVNHGICSLKFFAAKVWDMVPTDLKSINSIEVFKNKVKKWKAQCSCKLCATYVNGVGYCNIER